MAGEWIWKWEEGSSRQEASLGGSGGWEGKRTRWTDGCAPPGLGIAADPPLGGGFCQGCPARHHGLFSPLPPPLFPFSFTDHTLPFKRNATHIQRHKCSSLVSFYKKFFFVLFCFVLIKCVVLGIAAHRSPTPVQGNKQISKGLFAKPTLGFRAPSWGQMHYSEVLYTLYSTSKEFSYVRSVCLNNGLGW